MRSKDSRWALPVNPAEGGKVDLLSVLVSLRHKDGFLFRTPLFPGHRELCRKSNGGENKNA